MNSKNRRSQLEIRDLKIGGEIFISFLLFLFLLPILFPSCASIGSPMGGDIDTIPPIFIGSNPPPNSTNFNGKKIELYFNEYLSIEKPAEKVIITPPQSKMPVIRAIGKKISIELKDTLIIGPTYTFDFTNGIVDNNEKNAIEGFTFAFSTGDVIDSLVVSGLLLNAENLEPMPNIMVGLHSNLEDSAFTTLPFTRTSMTNEMGKFWIRNVAPGTYRLFALNDRNRNFLFDGAREEIAFYSSPITPDFIQAVRMDTVHIEGLTNDSIIETGYNRFIPDDITLFLFTETTDIQYLSRSERLTDRQFALRFNSEVKSSPTLNLLKDDFYNDFFTDWYIQEYSVDKKDITYWIKDSLIYKQDTIRVEANYMKTDSLNNLVPVSDTLRLVNRNREVQSKDNRIESKIRANVLKIDWTAKSNMEVYDTLKITFSEPVFDFDLEKIKIQQKVDTLWEDRNFPIVRDTLNPRLFFVDYNWYYEHEFRIMVDSASIFGIYDTWNDSIGTTFKFNSEKEYGNLYINIKGAEGHGFGELLDNSERVIRKSVLENGELVFEDLKPGNYFLRYIEDINENGKWDTGNYLEGIQPEKVFYFHSALTISKYGELDQDWDINQFPVESQKPLEITKNKPQVRQQRRNDQRDQNRQQNTGRTNQGGSIPGFGGRIPGM